jgi:hypothetical protein
MNFLRGLRNPPGITAKTAKEISGDCSAPAGPELEKVRELIGRFVDVRAGARISADTGVHGCAGAGGHHGGAAQLAGPSLPLGPHEGPAPAHARGAKHL